MKWRYWEKEIAAQEDLTLPEGEGERLCWSDFGVPCNSDAEEALDVARGRITELYTALQESLKLQKRYTELLNMYDGGERRSEVFASPEIWIARLREVSARGSSRLPERGTEVCGSPVDQSALSVEHLVYVCTMDSDCMPECCAQWRFDGKCANTGGDCKFRRPVNTLRER